MGVEEHKRHRYSLRIGVITVSSTRDDKSDESGKIIIRRVVENGHNMCGYTVVRDSKLEILHSLFNMLRGCDVVIINGGTGVSKFDLTYESVKPVFDKELNGFGELFRWKSYEDIGYAAMLSRATAGVVCGRLVFIVPGSPNAVKLASNIIFEELSHLWYEINR